MLSYATATYLVYRNFVTVRLSLCGILSKQQTAKHIIGIFHCLVAPKRHLRILTRSPYKGWALKSTILDQQVVVNHKRYKRGGYSNYE